MVAGIVVGGLRRAPVHQSVAGRRPATLAGGARAGRSRPESSAVRRHWHPPVRASGHRQSGGSTDCVDESGARAVPGRRRRGRRSHTADIGRLGCIAAHERALRMALHRTGARRVRRRRPARPAAAGPGRVSRLAGRTPYARTQAPAPTPEPVTPSMPETPRTDLTLGLLVARRPMASAGEPSDALARRLPPLKLAQRATPSYGST